MCRDEDVLAAGAEPPRAAARRGVVDQAAAVLRVSLRHPRGLLVPGLKIFACHQHLVSVDQHWACYHAQHVRGGRGDGGAERVVRADNLLPGVEVVPGEEPRRGQPRQGGEPGHWARVS